MTDPATTVARFEMIKPTAITPHPKNVRRNLGDLTELAASIKAQGVLQPVVVAPGKTAGKYVLITGHRRHAAAKKAVLKEVPCMVREDLTGEADQLQAMLTENLQRADLDAIEEGDAYQAILDLDVTVKDLSATTGTTQKRIKERVKLASSPADLRDKIIAHQVTLEEATILQSFANDADIYTDLQRYVGTHNWDWAVKRAKETRARATKLAKLIKELRAEGVRVLDVDERDAYRAEMAAKEGVPLDLKSLRIRPADVTDWRYYAHVRDNGQGPIETAISWLELVPADTSTPDPAGNGSSPGTGTSPKGPSIPTGGTGNDETDDDPDPAAEERAEATAARQQLTADLKTAASVRRSYLGLTLSEGDQAVGAACVRALIWEWSNEMLIQETAIDCAVVAEVLNFELPEFPTWQEKESFVRVQIRKAADPMTLAQRAILVVILHGSTCEATLENPRDWDPEYFDDWQRPYLELLDGPLEYKWSDVEKDLLDTLKAHWEGDEDSAATDTTD